jgi:hypothetical protein
MNGKFWPFGPVYGRKDGTNARNSLICVQTLSMRARILPLAKVVLAREITTQTCDPKARPAATMMFVPRANQSRESIGSAALGRALA